MFEGHQIIPVVKSFIEKHAVKEFTVVADAAMISTTNIQELLRNNINHIVGARLGNLSNEQIEQIDRNIVREDGKTIIERYNELYRVEQTFGISKHDLQTRPIFHFKEEPINLHILICFMALIVSKHIELTTGDSIRKF